MKFVFFILLSLITVAFAQSFTPIGYKACKSDGTVLAVKAKGCEQVKRDGKNVCLFKSGTKPVIQINFKTAKESAQLKTSVRAKIAGAMVDFPQSNNDACTYGVKCPFSSGSEQVFEQSIEISDQHPKGEIVQVNWQLTRADNGKEACIIFLAEISE